MYSIGLFCIKRLNEQLRVVFVMLKEDIVANHTKETQITQITSDKNHKRHK